MSSARGVAADIGRLLLFWVALLTGPAPALAQETVFIPPSTLSRVMAETSEKVTEIHQIRELGKEFGLDLATYGGTSRELADLVIRRVQKLGGVPAYEKWLQAQARIHLLDFHRIKSDLDFMIVLRDPHEPVTEAVKERVQAFKSLVEARFPSSIFHSNMDLAFAPEFFAKYPPSRESFEATSNLPVSSRGVEMLPELNVPWPPGTGGRGTRNLAEWGLEQFSKQQLEFARNPAVKSDDVYGNLRQALRWLRYLAENPQMPASRETMDESRGLLKPLVENHRAQVLALLKPNANDDLATKTRKSLQKLQLYTRFSAYARDLLDQSGLTALAQEAGVDEAMILEPLRPRDPKVDLRGKPRLGRELVVRHRTNHAAAQNISQGALWMSNNRSEIAGHKTAAMLGDGLYAAPGLDSLSYGDIFVEMTLSPEAVEGVDFVRMDDWFAIKTLDAFAKNPDGSYRITEVDSAFLQREFMDRLRSDPDLKEAERASIIRALANIVQPDVHPEEARAYQELLKFADESGLRDVFAAAYLSQPRMLRQAFFSPTPYTEVLLRQPRASAPKHSTSAYSLQSAALGDELLMDRLGALGAEGDALARRFFTLFPDLLDGRILTGPIAAKLSRPEGDALLADLISMNRQDVVVLGVLLKPAAASPRLAEIRERIRNLIDTGPLEDLAAVLREWNRPGYAPEYLRKLTQAKINRVLETPQGLEELLKTWKSPLGNAEYVLQDWTEGSLAAARQFLRLEIAKKDPHMNRMQDLLKSLTEELAKDPPRTPEGYRELLDYVLPGWDRSMSNRYVLDFLRSHPESLRMAAVKSRLVELVTRQTNPLHEYSLGPFLSLLGETDSLDPADLARLIQLYPGNLTTSMRASLARILVKNGRTGVTYARIYRDLVRTFPRASSSGRWDYYAADASAKALAELPPDLSLVTEAELRDLFHPSGYDSRIPEWMAGYTENVKKARARGFPHPRSGCVRGLQAALVDALAPGPAPAP